MAMILAALHKYLVLVEMFKTLAMNHHRVQICCIY